MTDDKKARRIAKELGVVVMGTPEVMKEWSEIIKPADNELSLVLAAIERFANYRPGPSSENFNWWVASVRTAGK